MYGKFGTYKTPISYNMAISIASGQDFCGLKVNKGNVLYLEHDTPRDTAVKRFKVILPEENNISLTNVFAYPGFDVCNYPTEWDKFVVSTLRTLHAKHKFDVVFADALRGIHPFPDKDSEIPPKVYRAMATLFPGASLFFVHHDRKSRQEETEDMRVESFSGSQAWINHATVGLKVRARSKVGKTVFLDHVKTQAGEQHSPILVKLVDDKCEPGLKVTPDGFRAFVDTLPIGSSSREIDQLAAEHFGLSERSIRRFRTRMEKDENS